MPPAPDLEALDVPVRAQYRERRAAVDAAAATTAAERARAYGALGQWYHAYMFYDGAAIAYRGAQALDPDDPRWPYYLAHVARATGDRETSAALLRRVLEMDSGHVPARVWLAETEDFDAALLRAPRCVRALAGRALELARQAIAGVATIAGAETLAMAFAELGRFTEAATWQEAALAAAQDAGRRDLLPQIEGRLELYRRRQPCREPWARDEVASPIPVTPRQAGEFLPLSHPTWFTIPLSSRTCT